MKANKIYFTCGPSQLYPTVPGHFAAAIKSGLASISHRSLEFMRIYDGTVKSLRKILGIPESHYVFFVSSSLESMERIIMNCVQKKSFHLVNGAFSDGFSLISGSLGRRPAEFRSADGFGFGSPESIAVPAGAELITITHNETSNGTVVPMDFITGLKRRNRNKLIALDIVSSAPFVETDFGSVDIAFLSVQKGFGMPAGLGVLIANKKAVEKSSALAGKGISTGSYHSFKSLYEKSLGSQTPETPNILHIYTLGKVCRDIMGEKGGFREKTLRKAELIYRYFDRHPDFKPYVTDTALRSPTTISVVTGNRTEKVIGFLERHGIAVSRGYGEFSDSQIRIANFPAHTVGQVKKLLLAFDRIG